MLKCLSIKIVNVVWCQDMLSFWIELYTKYLSAQDVIRLRVGLRNDKMLIVKMLSMLKKMYEI